MKAFRKSLLIASFTMAVLLGVPATSSAQDKEKGKEKAAEKGKGDEKAKGGGFTGKAVTVDKAAKTVKLSGEKARVIQIVAGTKISKDGKPATLEDLKEGDEVFGGYKMSADGKMEATVFGIGKPPAKKEKKDDKKEEKKDDKK